MDLTRTTSAAIATGDIKRLGDAAFERCDIIDNKFGQYKGILKDVVLMAFFNNANDKKIMIANLLNYELSNQGYKCPHAISDFYYSNKKEIDAMVECFKLSKVIDDRVSSQINDSGNDFVKDHDILDL